MYWPLKALYNTSSQHSPTDTLVAEATMQSATSSSRAINIHVNTHMLMEEPLTFCLVDNQSTFCHSQKTKNCINTTKEENFILYKTRFDKKSLRTLCFYKPPKLLDYISTPPKKKVLQSLAVTQTHSDDWSVLCSQTWRIFQSLERADFVLYDTELWFMLLNRCCKGEPLADGVEPWVAGHWHKPALINSHPFTSDSLSNALWH